MQPWWKYLREESCGNFTGVHTIPVADDRWEASAWDVGLVDVPICRVEALCTTTTRLDFQCFCFKDQIISKGPSLTCGSIEAILGMSATPVEKISRP